MSLLAMEHQNPDPFETERVGHPKKPNQSLSVDVQEWYHPAVSVRQLKTRERVGRPPGNNATVTLEKLADGSLKVSTRIPAEMGGAGNATYVKTIDQMG